MGHLPLFLLIQVVSLSESKLLYHYVSPKSMIGKVLLVLAASPRASG